MESCFFKVGSVFSFFLVLFLYADIDGLHMQNVFKMQQILHVCLSPWV